ncbi:MAG: PEGA domain-containing protein [Candidatus Saccharimonadales bacterium]
MKRSLIYMLMTLSVLTIVTVLILIILGYSFNRQDGRLEQGGLLQFASIPSGATITLGGSRLSSRTPSKANVDAASHQVEFTLKGYRSWQKTITVQPGGIGWLSYARLIPTEIKSTPVHTLPQLAASMTSNDRKWMVLQSDVATPAFTIVNIESDTPKITESVLPEALISPVMTDESQSYAVTAWSRDSTRLLVKRTYDTDKIEWFILNRQHPNESINLTTAVAVSAINVQFAQNDGGKVYALTGDAIVRRIDVGSGTLSAPLAENVSEYTVYDESTLLYVTHPDSKQPSERRVGYRTRDMPEAQTLFNYTSTTENIHVAFGEYYGKKYVAITYGTTLQVYTGTIPTLSNRGSLALVTSVELPTPPQSVLISKNGRFVVADMANHYTTYDIELAKSDTTELTRSASSQRPLVWLDDYLAASNREGMLRLFEFDGANQQDILAVVEGQAAAISRNDKYLYTVTAVDGGVTLTRVQMTVSQ